MSQYTPGGPNGRLRASRAVLGWCFTSVGPAPARTAHQRKSKGHKQNRPGAAAPGCTSCVLRTRSTRCLPISQGVSEMETPLDFQGGLRCPFSNPTALSDLQRARNSQTSGNLRRGMGSRFATPPCRSCRRAGSGPTTRAGAVLLVHCTQDVQDVQEVQPVSNLDTLVYGTIPHAQYRGTGRQKKGRPS